MLTIVYCVMNQESSGSQQNTIQWRWTGNDAPTSPDHFHDYDDDAGV